MNEPNHLGIGNLNTFFFASELRSEVGKIIGCQWSAAKLGHKTLAWVAVCSSKRKS